MSDSKKINKLFLLNIILFITFLLGLVALLIVTIKFVKNANIRYIIYLVLMLMAMILASMFRRKLDEIINLSYIIRIRENASEPLTLVHANSKIESYHKHLSSMDFKAFSNNREFRLYYKVTKDTVKKMFKKDMIEVVIILNNTGPSFHMTQIDDEIERLQVNLRKEKIRFNKLFITQIRWVDGLNSEIKNAVKEIIFIRSKVGILSTINIAIDKNKAVLLYSDTYSPSLYYKYHIEQIKKII